MSKKKVNDKEFYRQFLSLLLPLAFQNFMLSAVSAGDAAMLGFVNQDSLAAVSLATQIQFVLNLFLGTVMSGATIVNNQYWGNGDKETVDKYFGLMVRYVLFITLPFFATTLIAPEMLMKIYTSDKELIRIGSEYLMLSGFSYVLAGLSHCFLCVMKTTGNAKKSAAIGSSAIVLDLVLNAIFIFGLFGFPAMGARGAALTTVFSRGFELVLAFALTNIRPKVSNIIKPIKRITREFWKYSFPIFINTMVWGIGTTIYSVIIGHLGSDATAANSVATVVKDIVTCISCGISAVASIMVGNLLGADKLEKAKEYGEKIARISIVCAFCTAGIVLVVSPIITSLFELEETARYYLKWMLLMCSFYMIGRCINDIVIVGIFKAGGDAKFDAQSAFITIWLFILPLALIATFVLHLPVLAVYFIISLDEVVKLPWVYRHYKKYKWVKNITKEEM